ncbi:threonyl-tRNA synthetase family protein [Tritrichomonas foetus]|uniref:Probable threonine--tRNA ligase, cytoplasmic n=1 Tax=Tritrichomonas foetus TaxID=1144522 RepID=A0A1J4JNF9_9EUKA|nr:threonyl-tRNA synthetase family protein [Tritrichomonas foetus]|eukprot:OHT00657.1 threonyl-tRNA synthetase family protein [Tritrichomonas foetus]
MADAKPEAAAAQHQAPAVPEFVTKRLEVFNSFEDQTPKPSEAPIEVTLLPPNATSFEAAEGAQIVPGVAGVTTPMNILLEKCKEVKAVTCSIDGTLWDLRRPIVSSCKLTFITFDDERGKSVFWHSSAHILGAAIELELGREIAIGPATESGFFYDFDPHGEKVGPESLKKIQKRCESISKKGDFERKMITRENALKLFESNKYKQEILTNRVEPGSLVSVYRTGTFIDLCRGPHLANGNVVKAWNVSDISASMWNGQADKPLSRIRAITFPSPAELKEYKHFLEEAAKRDHRKLGVDHQLFFFHEWSPGCAFFYPDGAYIYNQLMSMIREQYHKRGFVEVITPNLYYDDLFKTSGHWQHYREDMFHFATEEDMATWQAQQALVAKVDPAEPCKCCADACREMGLKPMNCPGHCLVFRSRDRSYREMPIRMAEFGVIHRNEASGALSGLTRVRRFVQDDAHIFARVDQIGDEINDAIDFMTEVYGYFNMTLEFTLSTINMDKYMGDLKVWEQATDLLRQALVRSGHNFKEMPGEAAFYGPKIDCLVKDSLNRRHQLATIQLDFQLPEKFHLEYFDQERKPQRPVMIHRAVLGSLERFIGIAVEHFSGRFPFWASPHQIVLIPQNMTKQEQIDQCKKYRKALHDEYFSVSIDESSISMAKKINVARSTTLAHAIIIVGDKEVADNTVAVRWWNTPQNAKIEAIPFDQFLENCREMRRNHK